MNIRDETIVLEVPLGQGGMLTNAPEDQIPFGQWYEMNNCENVRGMLVFGGGIQKWSGGSSWRAYLPSGASAADYNFTGGNTGMVAREPHNETGRDTTFNREVIWVFTRHLTYQWRQPLGPSDRTRRYPTTWGDVTCGVTNGSATVTISGDKTDYIDAEDWLLLAHTSNDYIYHIDSLAYNAPNTEITLSSEFQGSTDAAASFQAIKTWKADNGTEKHYPLLFTAIDGTTYMLHFGHGRPPEKCVAFSFGATVKCTLIDGTADADPSDTLPPSAYYAMVISDHIIAARTSSLPNAVYWSDYLLPQHWDTDNNYTLLGPSCHKIIAVTPLRKDVGLIFSANRIWSMNYAGGSSVFDIRPAAETAIQLGSSISSDPRMGLAFYLAPSGLRVFDGFNDMPIDDVNNYLLQRLLGGKNVHGYNNTYADSPSTIHQGHTVQGTCLPERSEYVLSFQRSKYWRTFYGDDDPTEAANSPILAYNYKTRQVRLFSTPATGIWSVAESLRDVMDDIGDAGNEPFLNPESVSHVMMPDMEGTADSPESGEETVQWYLSFRKPTIRSSSETGKQLAWVKTGWVHPEQDPKKRQMKFRVQKIDLQYNPNWFINNEGAGSVNLNYEIYKDGSLSAITTGTVAFTYSATEGTYSTGTINLDYVCKRIKIYLYAAGNAVAIEKMFIQYILLESDL